MTKNKHWHRVAALLLALALAAAAALPGFAVYEMPIQTVNSDESVYLFELDTGKVILEQNADVRRPIASLTKMMTGLLMLESGLDLTQPASVPNELTDELAKIRSQNGTGVDLRVGENMSRLDLLYALLLPSANDAASVIAQDMSGSLPAFVSLMNRRAAELGCESTSFTCPHGLYDEGNYSTAQDLAKIAAACYANPAFLQIASTVDYTLAATNFHSARKIVSTNLMQDPEGKYYRDYIRGLKTGFTTKAGRCFVTFAEKNGHTYGLVVLGSTLENIYLECADLLDWVFDSFATRVLVQPDEPLAQVALKGSREAESFDVYAAGSVSGYGYRGDLVTLEFDLPDQVRATVKEGQVIGTATVFLAGEPVGKVELVSHESYTASVITDLLWLLRLIPFLLAALAVLTFLTILVGGSGKRRSRPQRSKRIKHHGVRRH